MYSSPRYDPSMFLGYRPNSGPAALDFSRNDPRSGPGRYEPDDAQAPYASSVPPAPGMAPYAMGSPNTPRLPLPFAIASKTRGVYRSPRDRPGMGGGVAQPDGMGGFKRMPGSLQYGGAGTGWTKVNSPVDGSASMVGPSGHVNDASTIGGSSNPYGGALDSYAPSPNIPAMARGGIVYPRRGGRIVRVAEAGYPEAVIPLHPGMQQEAQQTLNAASNIVGGGGIPAAPNYSNQGLASRSWRDNPTGTGVQQPDGPTMPWMQNSANGFPPSPNTQHQPSATSNSPYAQIPPAPGMAPYATPQQQLAQQRFADSQNRFNQTRADRQQSDTFNRERDRLRAKVGATSKAYETNVADNGNFKAGSPEQQQHRTGTVDTARKAWDDAQGEYDAFMRGGGGSTDSAGATGATPNANSAGMIPPGPWAVAGAGTGVGGAGPSPAPYAAFPPAPGAAPYAPPPPPGYFELPNGDFRTEDGRIHQRDRFGNFRELREQRPVDPNSDAAHAALRTAYETAGRDIPRLTGELDNTPTMQPGDDARRAVAQATVDASYGGATGLNQLYVANRTLARDAGADPNVRDAATGRMAQVRDINQRRLDGRAQAQRQSIELDERARNSTPQAIAARQQRRGELETVQGTIDSRLRDFGQGSYDASQPIGQSRPGMTYEQFQASQAAGGGQPAANSGAQPPPQIPPQLESEAKALSANAHQHFPGANNAEQRKAWVRQQLVARRYPEDIVNRL